MGMAAGAAAIAPRWAMAQAAPATPTDRLAQMRAAGASTPIKTTKLYDNVYLLQGAGGNMAVQTGPQGKILIDSSFSTAVPHIREALAALSSDPAFALINTHWHIDHTDGNDGMHSAGFTVYAHEKTRRRLSEPAEMKLFGMSLPASPAGALCPQSPLTSRMRVWHNGDSLELAHFDPAHTDTDIYIHFHKADVLHLGDIWFNGMYPFIDEGTGGSIGGMIIAAQRALSPRGRQNENHSRPRSAGNQGRTPEILRHAFNCARQGCRAQDSRRQREGSPRKEAYRRFRRYLGKRQLPA